MLNKKIGDNMKIFLVKLSKFSIIFFFILITLFFNSSILKADENKSTNIPVLDTSNTQNTSQKIKTTLKPVITESSSVELQIRKLSYSLVKAFNKLEGKGKFIYLAIIPFKDVDEQSKQKRLGEIITEEMATYFKRDYDLNIVEKDMVKAALNEIHFGKSGAFNEETVADFGNFVGAQAMVTGSVAQVANRYVISARVVSINTAETLIADKISIKNKDLIAFSENSVVLRSTSGAMFRSALIPGWGQFYNKEPIKGTAILALEGAVLAAAGAFHFMGNNSKSLYKKHTLGTEDEYDKGISYYYTRNVMIYTSLAIWAYNLFDTYMGAENLKNKN